MVSEEVLRRLREATVEVYQLGLTFAGSMIPPVPENCTPVPAGPLTFVVETRHLTDAAIAATIGQDTGPGQLVDDFGGTVHVHGAEDGLEHLRFDCFDDKPHYHYVHHATGGGNTVCRIDQYADGDPVRWTLGRLRERLPEMLDHAGSSDLARSVWERHDEVVAAVADVEKLLLEAQASARAQWATA